MSEESPLSRLKSLLDAVHLPAYLMAASPEIPFEQLLVSLAPASEEAGSADSESHYVMQLRFAEDILRAARPLDPQAAEAPEAHAIDSSTLQFFMELPMDLHPERLLETYRLLDAYSKLLPYGALHLTESGEAPGLFFNYNLAASSQDISALLIIDILESLQFFLGLFVPRIESLQREGGELSAILAATEADWESALQSLNPSL